MTGLAPPAPPARPTKARRRELREHHRRMCSKGLAPSGEVIDEFFPEAEVRRYMGWGATRDQAKILTRKKVTEVMEWFRARRANDTARLSSAGEQ